jgi:hypothetical protein
MTTKHGDSMEYNIGDMVIRSFKGSLVWNMIGIITAKQPSPTNSDPYYTIQWLDPEIKSPNSTTWQRHEFVSIEKAKKL